MWNTFVTIVWSVESYFCVPLLHTHIKGSQVALVDDETQLTPLLRESMNLQLIVSDTKAAGGIFWYWYLPFWVCRGRGGGSFFFEGGGGERVILISLILLMECFKIGVDVLL